MRSEDPTSVSLKFQLDVEDGWPPVAVEALPFRPSTGGYEVLAPPIFVKDLSVGDVIQAELSKEGYVESWHHISRSGRTTVWLLRLQGTEQIEGALTSLRSLGCNTVTLDTFGCYAVDVPDVLSINDVDEVLGSLDEESVAVAFPSMRHPE